MIKTHATIILIATVIVFLLLNPVGSALADDAPSLEIGNLSGASFVFSYAQLLEMPKTVVYAELYCDGALAAYGNWSGVLLSYLLTQAQSTPEVNSIQFVASDGYGVAIPIILAMQPQVIIAYEKDGQPLTEGLRLILPGVNGGAWIAMITTITMSTSGADYPAGVSVELPKANNMPTQSSPTQTSPSKQQDPQPQQSSENSSNIQEVAPANVTNLHQPAINPQVTNRSLTYQTLILYLIGFILAISLIATVYVTLIRKRKLTSETD